jgi:hypothetical protein
MHAGAFETNVHVTQTDSNIFLVVDSSIHPGISNFVSSRTFKLNCLLPDTGEPVPLPFRMSAFVPTNLVIVGGMLMPNPTVRNKTYYAPPTCPLNLNLQMASVIFWQWANQTLNGTFTARFFLSKCPFSWSDTEYLPVCVNYSNANKSIQMTPSEIACWCYLFVSPPMYPRLHVKSYRWSVDFSGLQGHSYHANWIWIAYATATITSVSLAVGLNKIVPRLRSLSPAAKALAQVRLNLFSSQNIRMC